MLVSIHGLRTPGRAIVAVGVAAALVAALMASLSSFTQSASAAKSEFKVLFIVPLSGPFAFAGKAEVAGLNAGIKTVNATGGVDGRRVTYKAVDDAGSGAKAAAAAVDELGKAKYDMVICGMSGADAPACTAAIAKRKMLQMAVAAEDVLGDPKQSPYTFVTLNRFDSNGAAVALRLKKDKKTKVAILAGDNASGRAGAAGMQSQFKKAKISVTDTVYVPTGAADATPQVQKAQSSGAQAIVIPAFNLQNVAIMKARTKLGWDVPAYLDPFAGSFNYASVLTAEERKNAFSAAFPFQIKGNKAAKTRAAKLFLKNVAVYDPKPVLAINAHNVAYNTIILAQAGAKKAKGSTAAKLLSGVSKLKIVAKDAPLAVGPKTLYTNRKIHAPQVKGSEYQWFKLGAIIDGLQVPA